MVPLVRNRFNMVAEPLRKQVAKLRMLVVRPRKVRGGLGNRSSQGNPALGLKEERHPL